MRAEGLPRRLRLRRTTATLATTAAARIPPRISGVADPKGPQADEDGGPETAMIQPSWNEPFAVSLIQR